MEQASQGELLSTVEKFPREVREIENVFIPLRDGTKLAARIWLPVDAEKNPVPAILEYLPYRKRDGTATRDALTHPYFAGHGMPPCASTSAAPANPTASCWTSI